MTLPRPAVRRLPAALILAGLLAAGARPARAFAGYKEDILPNGLRVILIEHRANPMIASSVVVSAGVVHEPEGMNGASHLLEHLLFNGTETRTQRQLYDEVDRYGAYNNATTREDHTLFSLLIQKEFIEKGLEIQADMLFHSTIPAENFEKENGIVLEEMARDEGEAGYQAGALFRRAAFAGTPLARPVLGTRESITSARRDDVWAYYKARYTPKNMVLVLMGDFEPDAMMTAVRRIFGPARPSSGTAGALPTRNEEGASGRVPGTEPGGARAATKSPGGEGGKATPARSASKAQRSRNSAWPARGAKGLTTGPLDAEERFVHAGFPLKLDPDDPLMPAIELLLRAFADGADAPLQRELTAGADPLAQSADLSVVPRTAPWSTVEFEATIPKDKPFEPVLDRLVTGLRSLGRGSTARGRVDAVRTRALADDLLTADQIHYYVLFRSSQVLGSPKGFLERGAARFEAVTDDDLDAAAARLADGIRDLRAGAWGPGLADSSGPAPASWTQPLTTASAPSAGVAPASRGLLSETQPSGLQAIVERNDDSDVFAAHLMIRPRSAAEPAGKDGITSFLHRLMGRGSRTLDAAALAARLDALGATLKTDDDAAVPYDDYYTTQEFSFLRLEMPSARWREGIALLAELVRYPRLDSDDVESVRREMLDLQSRRAGSSRSRAQDLADRTLAPGHPLSRPVLGTEESIRSITVEDLTAFHDQSASGARIVLSCVSPVDAREALDAIKSAFAGLPAGSLPAAPPAPADLAAGVSARETGSGKGPSTIVLSTLFDAPPEDEPALAVAGALLSDKLSFRLREEQGLAYSMGASIAPWAGRMRIQVSMTTRRENLEKALSGLRSEIAAFAPQDDDVKRAATALRGRMLMRRLTRINQAYFLGLERLDGRPPGDRLQQLAALLSVDGAAVRKALQRVPLDRLATIVVE